VNLEALDRVLAEVRVRWVRANDGLVALGVGPASAIIADRASSISDSAAAAVDVILAIDLVFASRAGEAS
jgi:hypothetical protein